MSWSRPAAVSVLIFLLSLAVPAQAQVSEVFPYEAVSVFGANNERDVNAESCDLVLGCFNRSGELCADHPDQACELATIPAGRCATGPNYENVWPSKSGECEGTVGYFERGPWVSTGIQEVSVGGVPCLTDAYRAALVDFSKDPSRDSAQIDALETVNGPSSMCPGNGICAHMRCKVVSVDTGVVACRSNTDCTARADDECLQANDNTGNCQVFDLMPSFCVNNPDVPCGVDADCPETCLYGPFDGDPCIDSVTDCGASDAYCDGGTNHNQTCIVREHCPGGTCVRPVCANLDPCSATGNDWELGVCGIWGRCSDGDPDLLVGGLGTAVCRDFVLSSGRVDGTTDCGRNAGSEDFGSPRYVSENPALLTPQRDPKNDFVPSGAIRRIRSTAAVAVQTAADATANSLGIRAVRILGDSVWQDAAFNSWEENGTMDRIRLQVPCNPPGVWETQLPVEGNCSNDPETFCVEDDDCPSGTCENLFFCHERRDPNNPALGPALDSVGFLWQRDIVDHEPVPAALQDRWSTDPIQPTCPPLCGTAYDHTTFESEAITNVGLQDRASGIQLALDSLKGRRAGAGDFLTLDAASIMEWIHFGTVRCQLGGQDPNDLVNLGTCSQSNVPCDPDNPVACAPVLTCQACGGRLIRPGDPLAATKGLNLHALPIGYDDHGFDARALLGNRRLGVQNGHASARQIPLFVVGTTGAAAAVFMDNPPCNPRQDRCRLGETPGQLPGEVGIPEQEPGGVGIGTGGTFAAGQHFAHGGTNRSGHDVSWPPENLPGPGVVPYVRAGSFGVGADGIPGCMAQNRTPGRTHVCKKRLSRGVELGQSDPLSTKAKWGFCVPPDPNDTPWAPAPPPACQKGTEFFDCKTPFGFDTFCSVDPNSLGFNTGADDIEILTPVEDPNTLVEGVQARFRVPNPSAPAPTLHWVSATAVRDLDTIPLDVDNEDIVQKTDTTLCPIDTQTGLFECFSEADCDDWDGDRVCDDLDNCPFFPNPGQEDSGRVGTAIADGIGDACQCGDVTGDGVANSLDATAITRCSIGFAVPPSFCNSELCDVTGDGNCDSLDATMIKRAALGLPAPLFGQNCAPAIPCSDAGGDMDGDGVCDDDDNCRFVANSGQEDCCTPGNSSISNPDGIGDACQCGDVTGDGQANSFDSSMIIRRALGLEAPLFNVPGNCDVTGEGDCNSFDATVIKGIGGPFPGWPPSINHCPNFVGPIVCGANICPPGEVCCNSLLGTCRPPGEPCLS